MSSEPLPPNDEERTEDFRLDAFLPYRFNVLAELMSRSLALIYQDRFGISVPEWRVLATLARESPLSAGEVGARTQMEKARVSRTLARMLDAGLITRQVDVRDNRVAVLALTRRGQELFRRITPLAREWEEQLLEGIDAAERAAFGATLAKLRARLDALRGRDTG